MKKTSLFLILSLILSSGIFALEVDEPELQVTGSEPIEFINYTGPHKVIDSLAAIKGIGSSMGSTITPAQASTTGSRSKYYVVHAVDPSEQGKLDADILFIGSDATVDHIVNLRRIISAYLSAAYGYSEKDGDTLATFITVYNAVYRGKLDVYQSKYKKAVTDNLTAENCGLSVNYKDWPGKSEIVIPLYDVNNGGLSTVDTSVISDSAVVDSMQEDDDKNVDSRKDMVDLKEREAEQASEKAQDAQKKATEETKKVEEKKEEAQQAEQKAQQAEQKAQENPNDKQAQKEAEEARQEAEEKKEEVKEQEKKAEEAKEEAKEAQNVADKKTNEAQEERKEIARDQAEIQEKEAKEAAMPSEYGIILTDKNDKDEMLSRLVRFNTETGEIIKRSPVTQIRNRTIYAESDEFIAVAGEDSGNAAIKLVTIDSVNMEITSESNETLAAESVLVRDGKEYYCVISDDNKWVVGRFNTDLVLQTKSPVAVSPTTPITITSSGVVVTDSSGRLRLLSKSDLTSITQEASSADAK